MPRWLHSLAKVPIVIPAYKPEEPLVALVRALTDRGAEAIIVVNDGSGPEYRRYFDRIADVNTVQILTHAVNLGKGAALKTGMNHALLHFPECLGVVTADADGQHHPDDILRIADRLRGHPSSLILGVRSFGPQVPWRSRFGNNCTRLLMHLMVGQKLSDTQTGLRGVPAQLIPHLLRVPSTGYEFELDMLIACKHQGCQVSEEPISTIYLEGNRSSHFHPIADSMRIYFLLFRFSALSVLTAALDNLTFAIIFFSGASIAQSQIGARLVAMTFNYLGARRIVFHSRQRHSVVLPKYIALVLGNGLLSYILIDFMIARTSLTAVPAKLIAEALLFIANFAIQRDFVFTRRDTPTASTDWDNYYTSVPVTARITRRYTTSQLLNAIKHYVRPQEGKQGISILEIGGANSCFLDRILSQIHCRSYDVVDTNAYGLSLLQDRVGGNTIVRLHNQDVLALSLDADADIVFSVGLVEHFDREDTRRAVLAHFEACRPGGLAIISFPTPTLLYRITRRLLEALRLWRFPDERPLSTCEVESTVRERGEVLFQKTLWPLLLTQHLIVATKRHETCITERNPVHSAPTS